MIGQEMDFILRSDELMAAYNDKDFVRLKKMVAEDVDFCHFNRGMATRNFEYILKELRKFAEFYAPDRQWLAPFRVTSHDNIVIREAFWTGTAQNDIPQFARRGEKFELGICTILRFNRQGLVDEWKDYG